MTPQEKAIELVEKFTPISGHAVFSQHYALIAVDEMLNNAGFIWGGRDTETGITARDQYRKYWQEVKQEIEKL
jgi:hypothetical protein